MADKQVQDSPTLKYTAGTITTAERIGPQGQLLTDSVHGAMYESSRNGTLFFAANQAATAVSVALTLTYTGLALYNPVGNNRDLIVRAVAFKPSIAIVALTVVGLMGGYVSTGAITAHTTPLVYGTAIWPCNLGSTATPTALVDSAATIVAPHIIMPFCGTSLAAAALQDGANYVDMHGSIILQPGAYAAVYALTAVTGIGGIFWEEVSR